MSMLRHQLLGQVAMMHQASESVVDVLRPLWGLSRLTGRILWTI